MDRERVLLISSSKVHGRGYLDHCMPEIRTFLGAGVSEILFIPYAQKDRDAYAEKVRERFSREGLGVASVHSSPDPVRAVREASAVFTGGGNTFLLLAELYKNGLLAPIRQMVIGGLPYFGSSAGSNIAGMTIKTTNDMPIIYPPSFEALGLLPFTVNPHYTDPPPEELRAGETRAERIKEFHEWNDNAVVGLRQEAMLLVGGGDAVLKGGQGAKLFRKDKEPEEFPPGSSLAFLWADQVS